jgi:hypothetical protein
VPARGRLRPLAASTVLRGRAAHRGAAEDQERPQSQLNALASGGHGGPWALSCGWQGSPHECAAVRAEDASAAAYHMAKRGICNHGGKKDICRECKGRGPAGFKLAPSPRAGGPWERPGCYAQGGDLPESGTLPPASLSPICRNRGRSPRVTVSPGRFPSGGLRPQWLYGGNGAVLLGGRAARALTVTVSTDRPVSPASERDDSGALVP